MYDIQLDFKETFGNAKIALKWQQATEAVGRFNGGVALTSAVLGGRDSIAVAHSDGAQRGVTAGPLTGCRFATSAGPPSRWM